MRRFQAAAVLTAFMGLACGGEITDEPYVEPYLDPSLDMEAGIPAPSDPAATFVATTEIGPFTFDLPGMCGKLMACGCAAGASTVEGCIEMLGKPDQMPMWDGGAAACAVALGCDEICNNNGISTCIERTAALRAQQGQAGHELIMGIMDNYPTGGPCAGGQTVVSDSYGNFVRCQ